MAYAFHRRIVINHAKCGTADSSNFPMLFSSTDPDFKLVAHGGQINNANGYDIAFYADQAGTTPLFWEIEQYDGVAGTLVFWVKIPTLSHSVDTVIYIFYSDPSITTFQSTATSVWNSDFRAVYHVSEPDLTNGLADSTINANNQPNSGIFGSPNVATGGEIANYLHASTAHNGIQLASANNVPSGNGIRSISCWYRRDAVHDGEFFGFGNNVQTGDRFGFFFNTTVAAPFPLVGEFDNASVNTPFTTTDAGTDWHLYHLTYDGTNTSNAKMYVDGVAQVMSGGGGTLTGGGVFTIAICLLGLSDATGLGFDPSGSLDEARVLAVELSQSWITAEFNNQSSPSTFYTLAASASTIFQAHPIMSAFVVPVSGAYANLQAHPVMFAETGISMVFTGHPIMQAIAALGATANLQAHPKMAPAPIAGQPETCVVDGQPTGIGSGGVTGGLTF